MNGLPKLPPDIAEMVKGPIGNPEVIRVLEQALEAARAGKMAGVVVVSAAGPEAISMLAGGGCLVTMAAGCAQMERMLLDQVFDPRKRSPLLVPTAGSRMNG